MEIGLKYRGAIPRGTLFRNMKVIMLMKDSLRGLMGADFRQEFPWEVEG